MSRASRAASLLLLLVGLICASPAAARDLSFQPLPGPAAGTCDLGARGAYRLAVAAGSAAQAALAPCLGTTTAGRVLLVAAPDEPRAGTTLQIVRVHVARAARARTLRVVVRIVQAPGDALTAEVLTTPRAAIRLGGGALPRTWTILDEAGTVLARGRV